MIGLIRSGSQLSRLHLQACGASASRRRSPRGGDRMEPILLAVHPARRVRATRSNCGGATANREPASSYMIVERARQRSRAASSVAQRPHRTAQAHARRARACVKIEYRTERERFNGNNLGKWEYGLFRGAPIHGEREALRRSLRPTTLLPIPFARLPAGELLHWQIVKGGIHGRRLLN